MNKSTPLHLFAASYVFLLLACQGPPLTLLDLENTEPDYSYDNSSLRDSHMIGIKTNWSPANSIPTAAQISGDEAFVGSDDFNFCYDVPAGEFDINQAAWMAFLSANAYAHFGYFGPQHQALGFLSPGGGDFDWEQCAIDKKTIDADQAANIDLFEAALRLDVMHGYVEERFIANERWGACAQKWFAARDDNNAPIFAGVGLPKDSFTSWLLQNPKLENYVEFGCGGVWDYDEQSFEEGSTQVMMLRRDADLVANTPAIVIVVFRGTEADAWSDISVDLAFFKIDLTTAKRQEQGWGPGWGEVHRGFFNAYRSIDEQARQMGNYLRTLDQSPQLYITGHSLGGALATIMASRVLQDMEYRDSLGEPKLDLRGVYTFGSPRVGNASFVTHFNELADKHGVAIGRVRNTEDLVTNTPKISFEHVGPMFHLTEAAPGSAALDATIVMYNDLATEPSNVIGSPSDHSITGYEANYQDDPSRADFNTTSYSVGNTGYYRRLHEVLVQSLDSSSPLSAFSHCP